MKYEVTGDGYYHSVTYGYDTDNNLSTQVEVTNGVTTTTTYTYDDDNRIETVTTGNTTVEYTYDTYGRTSQKVTKTVSPEATVKTETFTYTSVNGGTTSQVKKTGDGSVVPLSREYAGYGLASKRGAKSAKASKKEKQQRDIPHNVARNQPTANLR